MARDNLRRTGRDRNVTVVAGDGSVGYAADAPYDAISVAAGAPDVPAGATGATGRSRTPRHPRWRARGSGAACGLRKRGGRIESRVATLCRFVPLRGGEGWRSMRLRTAKDRLKIEHSIIDGVRDVLEELLKANPEIRSVIPGVIRPVRDARGKIKMRVTVPTQNGWKAIALSAGARQEMFISTDWKPATSRSRTRSRPELSWINRRLFPRCNATAPPVSDS